MVGARVKNQTLTRSSARTGKKVQRMDGFPRVLRRPFFPSRTLLRTPRIDGLKYSGTSRWRGGREKIFPKRPFVLTTRRFFENKSAISTFRCPIKSRGTLPHRTRWHDDRVFYPLPFSRFLKTTSTYDGIGRFHGIAAIMTLWRAKGRDVHQLS